MRELFLQNYVHFILTSFTRIAKALELDAFIKCLLSAVKKLRVLKRLGPKRRFNFDSVEAYIVDWFKTLYETSIFEAVELLFRGQFSY